MSPIKLLWTLCFIGGIYTDENVVVVRLQLNLEQQYSFTLNSSIEYMLEFVPNTEQRQYPSQFSVRTDGGDITHPLLITARQRTGAVTYQLPYELHNNLIYEMTRTLCYDDPRNIGDPTNCDDAADSNLIRNSFSLQISSTCYSRLNINILAAPTRSWALPFQAATSIQAGLTSPSVNYYQFLEDQTSVRLTLEADDNVCATVSVQNYSCPILQTEQVLIQTGQRMTMLGSAGIHIRRSKYPDGFYLVVVVEPTNELCTGEAQESDPDWLWEAMWGHDSRADPVAPPFKRLYVTVEESLTRSQYFLATSVTLVLFLVFYVVFIVLVYTQRWPKFGKYVWPRAPPLVVNQSGEPQEAQTEIDAASAETPDRRRRRGSTATFDSSEDSNSESDSESRTPATATTPASAPNSPAVSSESPEHSIGDNRTSQVERADVLDDSPPQSAGNGVQPTPQITTEPDSNPFGLPPSLNLGALSRHRVNVIRARSDRYLHTLYTVAVFYALPVLQFVSAFQIILNVSGSLDICYYNFLCAHPLGALSDFNHVFSNLGYLLLGALFMLQLRRRRQRRKKNPRSEEYGIPAHYGMLSSLGAGMMVVGVLSASYHVCPNGLNFQFDTAFMYVLAVVSMVKIYQSRHPDVNARAHSTFGILALFIALVVWGVIGGGSIFWAIFTVLHLFTFLLLSLRIYYVGQFKLERETLQMAARGLAQMPKYGVQPLYTTRLVLLLIANGVNWVIALYGLWKQTSDIASHLLEVLLINTLMHMIFYLIMKLRNGERPRWYSWCFLAGAFLAWIPGLYFFVSGSSNWSTTAALSRELNHQCMVLQFYDAHDLWHMLSAVALYLSFNAMLTWDDGLAAVKRTEIAVF